MKTKKINTKWTTMGLLVMAWLFSPASMARAHADALTVGFLAGVITSQVWSGWNNCSTCAGWYTNHGCCSGFYAQGPMAMSMNAPPMVYGTIVTPAASYPVGTAVMVR